MTDADQAWTSFQSPDSTVTLHCPLGWKTTAPKSEGVCLAVASADEMTLVELFVAEAPAGSALQASSVDALAKIAQNTIEGLRKEHPDLRLLCRPSRLTDWEEGLCVHFILTYLEEVIWGRRLGSVTDYFLIGKGRTFVQLAIKSEAFRFKEMAATNSAIAKSVRVASREVDGGPQAESAAGEGAERDAPARSACRSQGAQLDADLLLTIASAERGNPFGQYNLGVRYQEGDGVPRNCERAAFWYRKAAETGLPQAQVNLGWLYAHGEGVAKDYREAVRLFRQAADQGFADGEFKLGILYANGWGVSQDYGEALRWVRRAAGQGHAEARAALDTVAKRATLARARGFPHSGR